MLLALTLFAPHASNATSLNNLATTAYFYISPSGSDSYDGTAPAHTRGHHGPFASLDHARIAVEHLRAAESNRRSAIIVRLRGGEYELASTVHFSPQDSGTPASPTIYASYGNEHPIISGGRRLTNWSRIAGKWTCPLPKDGATSSQVCQLYVHDLRAPRPRLPASGYFTVAGFTQQTDGSQTIAAAPTPLLRNAAVDRDTDFVALQMWMSERIPVTSANLPSDTISLPAHPMGTAAPFTPVTGAHFFLDNVRSTFHVPGQWYDDQSANQIRYIPLPDQSPTTSDIVAPRLEQLVSIDGQPTGAGVTDVEFHNIAFEYSSWNTPQTGFVDAQAGPVLPAAIIATGAQRCAFVGCTFRHLGAWGLEWDGGCQNDRVESCTMTDLGAGGVKIGENRIYAAPRLTSHITLTNNLIAHGGRVIPSAVGVWIGQSSDDIVSHNDIRDFYYTGLSVGWTWGYGQSAAQRNTISYNRVTKIGQSVLNDLGGIYLLGVSPGTTITNNVVSDVNAANEFGWGIYLDEGVTGVVVKNNLAFDTLGAGLHQHYGMNNDITNNIFAFGKLGQIYRTSIENHPSFTFEHNIVDSKTQFLQRGVWSSLQINFDNNLYWQTNGRPIKLAHWTWPQWQAAGADIHSIVADPLFVNVAAHDFRLRPTSPAYRIGFVPFDTNQAGRLGDALPDPDPNTPAPFQAHDKP